MSEYVYPLDGPEYTADQAGAWHGTRTSGVWAGDGNLEVTVGEGWQLILSAGLAWFTTDQFWGKVYVNTGNLLFTLPDVDEALDRICRLVIRWNKTQNQGTAQLLVGELSSDPVAPTRQTSNEVYDLVLADYLLQHGDTEASVLRLTDQRLNEDLCGLMRDGVTRLPTGTLHDQYEAALDTLLSAIAQAWAGEISDGSITIEKLAPSLQEELGGALYFQNIAVSATTGDIATVSNSKITADHVVAEITWGNPSYITSDVTWTTSAGSLILNGTASSATTVNIVLVKKNN